jgi:hypothetical protein
MRSVNDERGLGSPLLASLLFAGVALALALASAHFYSPPNLNSASRVSPWLEPDFGLAAASSLVALGIGWHAGRAVVRARALSAVLVRTLIWFVLTILLAVAWASSVSLATLLIAPSHAFAGLRLAALARAWRAQRLWRK